MPTPEGHVRSHIRRVFEAGPADEMRRRLAPKPGPGAPKVPSKGEPDLGAVEARWDALPLPAGSRAPLLDPWTRDNVGAFRRNVENLIGTVKVPVGLAGPLRVNGLFAQGDHYVPLATTEAALVASYSRGCQLLTEAGGCTSMLLVESVSRAPGFRFATLAEAGAFVVWVMGNVEAMRAVAATTTRHGRLVDVRVTVEGNHVFLNLEFMTADAAGQNMATIAAEAVCSWILKESPIQPKHWFLEANLSGDKKASAVSFLLVRGRKVSAEALIPARLVEERLHTTPRRMQEYWHMSAMGGVLSGTMGVQGHYANALTALYMATGQDVACVAESAVGVTRMELTESGDLYASATLPNIMVGTVGGGTGLPTQRACLDLMGLPKERSSQALAEIVAAVCLAGELSIVGAICAGEYARAHRQLARPPGTDDANDA